MTYLDDDPIAEVRRNREMLLDKYGGIEGLHRHMNDERAELERRGWIFVTAEEIIAKRRTRVLAGDGE